MMGSCKCPHHWVSGLLVLATWVAAVAFFWGAIKATAVWGYESDFYFESAVVLMLLVVGTKVCKCCRGGHCAKMSEGNMCSHPGGCSCGDCGRCK